ncbi:hypothetical protein PIB30_051543 [Stylosanthes scabra]|uniref:Uncharacterized protein n=1 Tax=Stylosanthes scabra TaxID=79078 RepID=A0ABU6WG15_9FABA|nr:hypothetical protein [Stylosanthes scabra]
MLNTLSLRIVFDAIACVEVFWASVRAHPCCRCLLCKRFATITCLNGNDYKDYASIVVYRMKFLEQRNASKSYERSAPYHLGEGVGDPVVVIEELGVQARNRISFLVIKKLKESLSLSDALVGGVPRQSMILLEMTFHWSRPKPVKPVPELEIHKGWVA